MMFVAKILFPRKTLVPAKNIVRMGVDAVDMAGHTIWFMTITVENVCVHSISISIRYTTRYHKSGLPVAPSRSTIVALGDRCR